MSFPEIDLTHARKFDQKRFRPKQSNFEQNGHFDTFGNVAVKSNHTQGGSTYIGSFRIVTRLEV